MRALNPVAADDASLMEAVGRGEFMLHGFRNRDLSEILHGTEATGGERAKQVAKVTRLVAILRAHGLIAKAQNPSLPNH